MRTMIFDLIKNCSSHFWLFTKKGLNWLIILPNFVKRQRYIQVNPTWNYYKAKVKETPSSDEGKMIYRRRKFDIEPVFGRMKRDFGVRRTHLRGQRAVENNVGLTLMALNLTKLGKIIK